VTARDDIAEIIMTALADLRFSGKVGQKLLQPTIAKALARAGYQTDLEDKEIFLPARLPVWRSKDNCEIERTKARRKIDIVVRHHNRPIALVETESDLNDLRQVGVTKRNGHYDVFSISRTAGGTYFDSYKSLERMAAAAYYAYLRESGNLAPNDAADRIAEIQSNSSRDHNPMEISLFLVTGSNRSHDEPILSPRLLSLNASLITRYPNI
jgi:hypothetical protein